MRGIGVVGRRGGVGKTSIAHLLALGAAWKLKPAVFVHTDDRPPLITNERPYRYIDARDPKKLAQIANAAADQEEGFFIVDSGGNRPSFDKWIAKSMDLVLIPVTPDKQAIDLALEQMANLKEAGAKHVYYIINQMPENRFSRIKAIRKLERIPLSETLFAMKIVAAVDGLIEDDDKPFETQPTRVNNLARNLFAYINYGLDCIERGDSVETMKAA